MSPATRRAVWSTLHSSLSGSASAQKREPRWSEIKPCAVRR